MLLSTTASQRALLRTFIAAMYSANQYLADSAKKKCNIKAIASQLNVSTTIATSAYNSVIDPLTGETSSPGGNFTVNRQGLLYIIDVRNHLVDSLRYRLDSTSLRLSYPAQES